MIRLHSKDPIVFLHFFVLIKQLIVYLFLDSSIVLYSGPGCHVACFMLEKYFSCIKLFVFLQFVEGISILISFNSRLPANGQPNVSQHSYALMSTPIPRNLSLLHSGLHKIAQRGTSGISWWFSIGWVNTNYNLVVFVCLVEYLLNSVDILLATFLAFLMLIWAFESLKFPVLWVLIFGYRKTLSMMSLSSPVGNHCFFFIYYCDFCICFCFLTPKDIHIFAVLGR